MSQHSYTIANQLAPSARADINLALKALASNNSGATAPSTTYANQFWYDTTNDQLKVRNEANSGWIVIGAIDQTNNKFEPNFTPASNAEALAGTDNTKTMTPLRVEEAIVSNSIGWGQTWVELAVPAARTYNVAYQNTTGKPIQVSFAFDAGGANRFFQTSLDGVNWVLVAGLPENGTDWVSVNAIIPNGNYYRVSGSGTFFGWSELR